MVVALAWVATSACGGSSKSQEEQSDTTSGGAAGSRPSTGGSDAGRSGGGAGGSGARGGAAGTAGSAIRGGQGGTAGASCADERVATNAFCLGGYDCPLTLDALRRVEEICRRDGEDGYYTECDGYARFEWNVGFGENWYDLVFSTATGELVYGNANVYDSVCDVITTTAGTRPPLGGCATCTFCRSLSDDPGGAGGEGGAGTGDRCLFDSDERVTLP